MDLVLKDIKLENFRNYEHFESGEFDALNIFVGENGAGKTNIVEAIQLITTLESFRNPKWDEVVRWGSDMAFVDGTIVGDKRVLEVRMRAANQKRQYYLNGKGKKNKDLRGLLPAVIFCPDDLQLVKGSSESRRNALDSIGTQISNTYHDLKREYGKSIKQKNALLQGPAINPVLLDSWNENIALIGSAFVKHRLSLFSVFRQHFVSVWSELVSDSDISVLYSPSWEEGKDIEIEASIYTDDEIREKIHAKIESHREAEIATGRSLVGPHRDDVRIYLKGADARKFASQGQQRFIALSWKIAEMRTIGQICEQQPILLLDDVLSELDRTKKDILMGYLVGNKQTFITATDVDMLDDRIIGEAKIFDVSREDGPSAGN